MENLTQTDQDGLDISDYDRAIIVKDIHTSRGY
jgi:hypothetical protein